MKTALLGMITGIALLAAFSQKPETDYLGEAPPGTTAVIFAPGVVSTEEFMEATGTFTPDGKEFYFTRGKSFQDKPAILVCRREAGGWTSPEVAPFSGRYFDFESLITPDGKRMFFMRQDREDGSIQRGLWSMDRMERGWSKPRFFRPGMFATATKRGTLYYTQTKTEKLKRGIVYSRFVNGKYTEPEYTKGGMEAFPSSGHPCISHDESFIVFDAASTNGEERGSLYVCFRLEDGTWSKAYDFGSKLNSASKNCASLSPDGKYLFYTHFTTATNTDIYWVSIDVIENIRKQRSSHS